MMTMVSAALGMDIRVGVLLKTAVKEQLRLATLVPITSAWGDKLISESEKAVMPLPMAMGREKVAAETAPNISPLMVANLNLHPFHVA